MKLAEDLEPYPDTAQRVDSGEVKVKDALEEAAKEAKAKNIEPPALPPRAPAPPARGGSGLATPSIPFTSAGLEGVAGW
jgi:hypothetical protein